MTLKSLPICFAVIAVIVKFISNHQQNTRKIMGKKILQSKTIWVNLIAIVGDIVLNVSGHPLPAGWDIGALSFINMVLRLTTKQPIVW